MDTRLELSSPLVLSTAAIYLVSHQCTWALQHIDTGLLSHPLVGKLSSSYYSRPLGTPATRESPFMEARSLPPLTVWNDHNHVGPIAGATVVMMVLSLVAGIMQICLFLKRCRSEGPHLQHDPLKLHIVVQAVSMVRRV